MSVITRVWHGRTSAEHADEYLQFVIESGVPDYKSVPGNISVEIWRRIEGDICHFWTVTKWDSFESIQKFAGEDLEKAKYYDDDAKFLLEFEEKVIHCETFVL
ncbi:MAG: antibiotic biosynthesis monooxygenase [Chloracidobacterium sp.]|nr:antibiotic biosynthesis monooxygenase [Chloracidobacterium sp.]